MLTKQVRFHDKVNDEILGGILCEGGVCDYIICGCCGGIVEADDPDIEILEVYKTWANISESITGEEA